MEGTVGTNGGEGAGETQAKPDILLVGCVKGKLEWASRVSAKKLYASPLWRSRRSYAEQGGRPWFILSAKHGLLHPEERIAWYDLDLSSLPAAERRAWSARVVDALLARYSSIADKVVEIHAGNDYIDFGLASGLEEAGAIVERPLRGIPIGRHLGWYRERGSGGDSEADRSR